MTIEIGDADEDDCSSSIQMTTSNNFHLGGPFSELQEQEHEESTEENIGSSKNSSAVKREEESILIGDVEKDVRTKKDELFAKLFGNKENSHPNSIEKPGRFSLQP